MPLRLGLSRKPPSPQAERGEECVSVSIPRRKQDPLVFSEDEFVKPQTTPEGLSRLRPAFRPSGTVTAGNASGLNDGAAALLLASKSGLAKHGLTAMTRICSSAVVGVEPRIMGIGPVGASRLALERAGLQLSDMDLIELNEAFAAQALACTRALGLEDFDPTRQPARRGDCVGAPAGNDRCAPAVDRFQAAGAREKALRPRDSVHRCRSGLRGGSGKHAALRFP